MLGVNRNGNNWKLIIVNFLIVVAAQIAFELYETLPIGVFPTVFELYEVLLKALIATLAFYGINKTTHKEK